MAGASRLVHRFILPLARASFFLYGFLWTLKPRRARSLKEVLKLFYLDFLRVEEEDVEVLKLDDEELVTRCRNPCPILKLSLRFNLDTRRVCREVSEPVCRYVLSKLNPCLVFERNYGHIRPYEESCEERIRWRREAPRG